jgi:hypothetical protein
MTPDPTQDENVPPDAQLPPESRAARSLTDRSVTDRPGPDGQVDETHVEPEPGPRIWPRVVGVLILLVGVGGAWLWQDPGVLHNAFGSLFPRAGQTTEADRIDALEARVAALEQRPPADLAPLTQRLDALEKRGSPEAPADLAPLRARLDALEASVAGQNSVRPTASGSTPAAPQPDLRPLLARIDALEKTAAEHAAEPAKVDAISSEVQALSSRDPAAELRGRLDDVTRKLDDLTASASKQNTASAHAERLARIAAADMALTSGHPIGQIADAPPALARFATTAPPTEAALRLGFETSAQEALKVSLPDTEGKPFLDRVLARLQDFKLITVREGDHVVIGNSAVATLAQARTLLDAGDLAGAAHVVATLTGPPAEKMAPWLADANALVAAREALSAVAGKG